MVERSELLNALDGLLQPAMFHDYAPNGLQVEGRSRVRHLVSGVTASLALIDAAISAQACAVLVHHGLFWNDQSPCVTGWIRHRLARLLANDISLLAYHLPLDAHPLWGNNAQLGQKLGLQRQSHFGEHELGCLGQRDNGAGFASPQTLADHIQGILNRPVTLIEPLPKAIHQVAWCSGGAQSYFEAAIAAGADAFITGEISEPQVHLARECGVAYLACGHHATERYGAPAVASHLAERFGIDHTFIDIDNPV